jgi:hypothetical protein
MTESSKKRFIFSTIPKCIHTFSQLHESVYRVNPSYQIRVWTKEQVETLIADKYPWFKPIYDDYDSDEKKQICGMFFILYTFGGISVHPNVECVKPFDPLLQQAMFMGCNLSHGRVKTRYIINTAVIGCVPMHSFWPHVFNMLKSNTNCYIGSVVITKMVELFPKSVIDVCLLEPGYFYQEDGDNSNAIVYYKEFDVMIEPKGNTKDTVMITILARNKAHVLPLYLKCIERLDYPKEKIHLYVHTNDNIDDTEDILRKWLSKMFGKYASYELVTTNEQILHDDNTDAHHWIKNRKRLDVLARIRQQSFYKAVNSKCDYYFVADCDNFLLPHTLKSLISCNKPFVAPILHCIGDPKFSNFFLDDNFSNWDENEMYQNIISMKNRNMHQVHIAHCTYLIQVKVIHKLTYISKHPGEWEFLTLSKSAHAQGIPQHIDNRFYYGIFLHFWSTRENEIRLFKAASVRMINILHEMEVQQDDWATMFEMLSPFKIPPKEEFEHEKDSEESTLSIFETNNQLVSN